VITQNPAAGTLLPLGQYLVTITATDAAGNTNSAGVSLTVANATSPVIPAVAAYGVLQLGNGKVSISGGGVSGDVAVGPEGVFAISGPSFVTGRLFLTSGDTFSRSGSAVIGNIVQNADLTTAINAAMLTSAVDAQLGCAQSFTTWRSSKIINGVAGDNVICVQNVALSGGSHITLNGPAGARFIINVLGSFAMSGSGSIRVSGGASPNGVVYNLIGTGNDAALSGGSAVDGSILAVSRNVNLSGGFINGQVISGKNVALSSGQINSTVGCTR
jgi:choice-of-anchor A domain-containing protein